MDGKRIACVYEIAEKNADGVTLSASFKLLVNGKEEGALYDEIENVDFSPDSATLAFGARKGAQQTLVVNGKELRWFEYLDPNVKPAVPGGPPQCPMPRPGLPRCLFVGDLVSDGFGFLVSSKGEKRLIKAEDYGIHSLDGKHVAIEGPSRKQVVVDGEAGPEFAKIFFETIRFSADSKHLSYAAQAPGWSEIVRVDVDVKE